MDHYFLTEHQHAFQNNVRRFAEESIQPQAEQIDQTATFPAELFAEMGELGFLGATTPEVWGGSGCDAVMVCLLLEEVSRASGAVGSSLNAHISLVATVLAEHGTDAQRERYLKPLASGQTIGAFGLTEPGGGSNAAACRTRADKRGDHYIINGAKCFITNSTVADTFIITARTQPGDTSTGVSAFILERNMLGFSIGPDNEKMGMHGSPTATLTFDELAVPAENLLGKEGQGFRQFAKALDRGRVNVAALSTGLGQAALDACIPYVKEREQFGQPIAAFQGVQFPIADMATEIEIARVMTLHAARLYDASQSVKKAGAMAKYFAAEASIRATSQAVELLGGYGYMRAYSVERYMRDAKMYQIGEGTSQINRLVIAREVLGRF